MLSDAFSSGFQMLRNFTTKSQTSPRPLLRRKQVYYHKLWLSLTSKRWADFEALLRQMKNENINDDEITYTLRAHYYILNPTTPSINSYMVIEEMKRALVDPRIIRTNENMLHSYFELEDLKCQPPKPLWQNFTKFIWQSAFRLNRRRQRDFREALLRMDPNDVMELTMEDIADIAVEEFHQAMQSQALAIDEAHDDFENAWENSEGQEFIQEQESQRTVYLSSESADTSQESQAESQESAAAERELKRKAEAEAEARRHHQQELEMEA